jgi:hypothetical protein
MDLPFRGNVSPATVALGLAIVVSLAAAIGTRITAVIALGLDEEPAFQR